MKQVYICLTWSTNWE